MRHELVQLIDMVLAGDMDAASLLHDVLEGCLYLEPVSLEQWKDQGSERRWADFSVERTAPDLAYFLPTPRELNEVLRQLRVGLVRQGRLSLPVMTALDRFADVSCLYTLADVLAGYDGDANRAWEVATALSLVHVALEKTEGIPRLQALSSIVHVRDVGGAATWGSTSISQEAQEILDDLYEETSLGWHADSGDFLMEEGDEIVEAKEDAKEEEIGAWTIDVVLVVAPEDFDIAPHLVFAAQNSDRSVMTRPVVLLERRPLWTRSTR